MAKLLKEWEREFDAKYSQISSSVRCNAGGFLPVIPNRQDWDDFLISIRLEWPDWQNYEFRPLCFLALLCGTAFFEYDEAKYWPNLQNIIGLKSFPLKLRDRICDSFKHRSS